MPMDLRDYQPEDRIACLAVFDSNLPRYFAPDERGEFDLFLTTLDQAATPYQVLLHQGEIVACGGYSCDVAAGEMLLIWGMVSQALHGQGLGSHMTKARLDAARADSSITRVRLSTSQHVQAFYARYGFEVTATTPDGFGPGIDRIDMALTL